MLNIAFLGTGGNMPMPDRFLSSILINYKGRKILIDCGEGTQVAMRMVKWGFKSIDIILITHEHGDHIFGLPGLLSTIGNSERKEPITIIGPVGIGKVVEGLIMSLKKLPYKVHIIEAGKKSFLVDFLKERADIKETSIKNNLFHDLIISTIELDHSAPCIGYSIYVPRRPKFSVEKAKLNNVPKEIWKSLQMGETVEYNGKLYNPQMVLGKERKGIKVSLITDTRPIDSIVPFIKDSNLLICEGTYGDDKDIIKAQENKHMTFSEAAALASAAKVQELILTHFSPSVKEPKKYIENAKNVFANSTIAYDGFIKKLKFNK